MSFNKETMLEQIEKSRTRYRNPQSSWPDRLARYEDCPHYERLTYHNADHVRDVMALFDLLCKIQDLPAELNDEVATARLALTYHDIDHSGLSDAAVDENGLDNIERAIGRMKELLSESFVRHTPAQFNVLADYVRNTRYPAPESPVGPNCHPLIVALMRDADVLWGLLPGNYEQSMLGLWMERVNSGAEEDKPCDIEKLLIRQIHFIRDYEPLTRAGHHFKQAFYVQATEGWALVALEFMRQKQAAEAVSDMADEEVLVLRQAIKNQVSSPTA